MYGPMHATTTTHIQTHSYRVERLSYLGLLCASTSSVQSSSMNWCAYLFFNHTHTMRTRGSYGLCVCLFWGEGSRVWAGGEGERDIRRWVLLTLFCNRIESSSNNNNKQTCTMYQPTFFLPTNSATCSCIFLGSIFCHVVPWLRGHVRLCLASSSAAGSARDRHRRAMRHTNPTSSSLKNIDIILDSRSHPNH